MHVVQRINNRFGGDLSKFFEFVPLSDPSECNRYKEVLSGLLKAKVNFSKMHSLHPMSRKQNIKRKQESLTR